MARETGKISEIQPGSSTSKGSIERDNGFDPNPCAYDDPTIITRGITLKEQDPVEYDIDDTFVAKNITLITATDPDLPPDEGDVKTADINGNLSINGNTVTLKGVTVSGNVEMKGGKLIMKPNDTGRRSKIIGNMDGKDNARIVVYKSDAGGNIDFKDSVSFSSVQGTFKNVDFKMIQTFSSKDDTFSGNLDGKNNTDVSISRSKIIGNLDGKNNNKIAIGDGEVTGNIDLKNNANAAVTNTKISGNLTLKNNTVCSQSGNTVGGSNSGCQ